MTKFNLYIILTLIGSKLVSLALADIIHVRDISVVDFLLQEVPGSLGTGIYMFMMAAHYLVNKPPAPGDEVIGTGTGVANWALLVPVFFLAIVYITYAVR